MDDFVLNEDTVRAMNEEYDKVLPACFKALQNARSLSADEKSPKINDELIKDGWLALYAYCKRYAQSHSFSPKSTVVERAATRISDLYFARFACKISDHTECLSPEAAFVLSIDLYMALPTPDCAVIMNTIGLTLT